MVRKTLFALVILGLCFTFVAAETVKGRITKVDEASVTVKAGTDAAKSYDLAKGCKFYLEIKGVKEEIKDGARAEVFKKIPDKGLNAIVEMDSKNKVKEIVLTTK